MVEKIYCALLTDDNLVAFGTTAMIRIDSRITSNKTVCSKLSVAIGKNSVGANKVINYLLQTYHHV
jgi:hypothetical protein